MHVGCSSECLGSPLNYVLLTDLVGRLGEECKLGISQLAVVHSDGRGTNCIPACCSVRSSSAFALRGGFGGEGSYSRFLRGYVDRVTGAPMRVGCRLLPRCHSLAVRSRGCSIDVQPSKNVTCN